MWDGAAMNIRHMFTRDEPRPKRVYMQQPSGKVAPLAWLQDCVPLHVATASSADTRCSTTTFLSLYYWLEYYACHPQILHIRHAAAHGPHDDVARGVQ